MTVAYLYGIGRRWRKHDQREDVRLYRAPKGWEATAFLLDSHPITGKAFRSAQWWILERFTGGQP